MARRSIDILVDEFRKNPERYADVVRIGKGSEGLTMREAKEKFGCGTETISYWRKVYSKALGPEGDNPLVTIQVPIKLVQKVKDQAQRIQFLEASLWRKSEEVADLKLKLEELKA